MFKERNEAEAEAKVEPLEGKERSLDVFRGKVLRALFLTGYMAVLEACGGLRREDMDKMPMVELEEVVKNPESYKEVPLIKTEGYPEKTGSSRVQIPFLRSSKIGDYTIYRFDWVNYEKESYKLHASPDRQGSSIDIVVDPSLSYTYFLPDDPEHKIQSSGLHKHEVAGKLIKIKIDGKEVYALQMAKAVDTEAPKE